MSVFGELPAQSLAMSAPDLALLVEAALALGHGDEAGHLRCTQAAQAAVPTLLDAEMLARVHLTLADGAVSRQAGECAPVASHLAAALAALRADGGRDHDDLIEDILVGLAELAQVEGLHADARVWFEHLAQHHLARGAPLAASAARNSAGLEALDGGDPVAAVTLFKDCVDDYRRLDRPREQSSALHNLALARMRLGDYDAAGTDLAAALKLAADGDDERRAHLLSTVGLLATRTHEHDRAEQAYLEARELYLGTGRVLDALDMTVNLGALQIRRGDLPAADATLEATLAQLRRLRVEPERERERRRSVGMVLTTLAAVRGRQGRLDASEALLAEAETVYRELRLPRELADVLTNQGYVALHRGELASARERLRVALATFDSMSMAVEHARLLTGFAAFAQRIGDLPEADALYRRAEMVYVERRMQTELAGVLVNRGIVAQLQQDADAARELLERALTMYQASEDESGEATARFNLGLVAQTLTGDLDLAQRMYHQAKPVFERLGQTRELAELEANLGIVAAAEGRIDEARLRYRAAHDRFEQVGAWLSQARCRHNEGLTHPVSSPRHRELVISAWFAADAVRHTLPLPQGRGTWRRVTAPQTEAAFLAAAAAGPLLLAEVLESARAAGGLQLVAPPAVDGMPGVSDAPDDERALPVLPPVPLDLGWPAVTDEYRQWAAQKVPPPDGAVQARSLVQVLA